AKEPPPPTPAVPFTRLDGRWNRRAIDRQALFEPLEAAGPVPQYRRRSDGMRGLLVPSAAAEIGCEPPEALADERPQHIVKIDSFLIDAEPVSTTAYCRFLISLGDVPPEALSDWFVLDLEDDRIEQMLVRRSALVDLHPAEAGDCSAFAA